MVFSAQAWIDQVGAAIGRDARFRSPDTYSLFLNLLATVQGAHGAPRLPFSAMPSGSGSVAAGSSLDLDYPLVNSALYKHYLLLLSRVQPATDATTLLLRTSSGSPVTFDAGANYSNAGRLQNTTPTGTDTGGVDGTGFTIGLGSIWGNAANEIGSALVFIMNPHSTDEQTKLLYLLAHLTATPALNVVVGGGRKESTAANDSAFRLLFSSGNITTMDWTLLGIPAQAGVV